LCAEENFDSDKSGLTGKKRGEGRKKEGLKFFSGDPGKIGKGSGWKHRADKKEI